MKNLIVFILSLISINIAAQDMSNNNCIWDICYGSSYETVKNRIFEEKGLNPSSSSSSDYLMYNDFEYDGQIIHNMAFCFVDDQLYMGVVGVIPQKTPDILLAYDKLKKEMKGRFGNPTKDVVSLKSPYKEDHKNLLQAVKDNKADIHAVWENPSTFVLISVCNDEQPWALITYTNKELYEASQRKKSLAKEDR